MKNRPPIEIEQFRITHGPLASDSSLKNNGAFVIPYKDDIELSVIISDGKGWDHVSVSLADRCPTWDEMCFIKDIFFTPFETVVQFHPRKDRYINNHKFCLHMWRYQRKKVKLPPSWMIGI